MESKILLVAAICCAPSIFYLVYILGKYLNRWLNRHWPALSVEDVTQLVLVMVSIICFGLSLCLVVLNFVTPIPYFHRGKSLIIALLFLLMGILCIQVFQFVRWQSRQKRPPVRPAGRRPVQNPAVRGFVATNQKG